jgi:hypothetical protein
MFDPTRGPEPQNTTEYLRLCEWRPPGITSRLRYTKHVRMTVPLLSGPADGRTQAGHIVIKSTNLDASRTVHALLCSEQSRN